MINPHWYLTEDTSWLAMMGTYIHPKPVCRMTEDELRDLTMQLVNGQIYTANDSGAENISMVFMVLGFGWPETIDIDSVGMVYEEISKAAPRSVNGMPMFFSVKMIHKLDWPIIVDRARRAYEAMHAAASGS